MNGMVTTVRQCLGVAVCAVVMLPLWARAATDGVYVISVDNIGFAGGEPSTDGTYGLMDTVGEPIVGVSADGTYQTQDGFWYRDATTLTLALDAAHVQLGQLVPGTPVTGTTTATVTTNAPNGYQLFIHQDHDLQHTADPATIPALTAGTIAVPVAWGTAVGLGITLTSGTNIAAKWGVPPNNLYAAIPGIATLLHTKSGYGIAPNDTVVQYRVDAPATQKTGTYTNVVTYTAAENL